MITIRVMRPPGVLSSEQFTTALVGAMEQAVGGIYQDFGKTVATWRDKPEFERTVEQKPGQIIGTVATDNAIYRYVSGGTSVRYATMTPDFAAKTQPRVIGSGPGAGGRLFVSRQHPRPGIEARQFDAVIAKKHERKLAQLGQAALKRAVFSSGFGMNK